MPPPPCANRGGRSRLSYKREEETTPSAQVDKKRGKSGASPAQEGVKRTQKKMRARPQAVGKLEGKEKKLIQRKPWNDASDKPGERVKGGGHGAVRFTKRRGAGALAQPGGLPVSLLEARRGKNQKKSRAHSSMRCGAG